MSSNEAADAHDPEDSDEEEAEDSDDVEVESGEEFYDDEEGAESEDEDEEDEGSQGMLDQLFAMIAAHSRSQMTSRGEVLEGATTADERTTIQHAVSSAPLLELRALLAVHCARTISFLRQLPVHLPPELMVTIAEQVLEHHGSPDGPRATGRQMCVCEPRGDHPMRPEAQILAFADSPQAPPCHAVCWKCGRPTFARCTPRVRLEPGGEPQPLRTATVAVNCSATHGVRLFFKPCRHFHLQRCGTDGGQPADADLGDWAVRHRASGLHSFRTVVAGEWVVSGAVTYEVCLRQLRWPLALGVGVVSPRCRVNRDTAWAAGTRGWEGACGVVVEERAADEGAPFSELRASAHRAVADGRPMDAAHLPLLLPHDRLRCTVDAARRTFSWCVVRGGVVIAPAPELPEAGRAAWPYRLADSIPAEGPLALAVALKFAGDAVSLHRDPPACD